MTTSFQFDQFPAATRADWLRLAAAAAARTYRSDDGIEIEPLPERNSGAVPAFLGRANPNRWDVRTLHAGNDPKATRKAIADDIRDKFLEAKSVGFDVKALRQIVRLRKKTRDQRQEEESILEVYLHALGMIIEDGPSAPSHVADQMLDAAE